MAEDRDSDSHHLRKSIEHHDKAISDLREDVAGVTSRMSGVERTLHSVDQKIDRFISGQSAAQANRPTAILDAIRTGLSILQAMAFLVGCTVAAIVYVSSNANNSELSVMKYQISELKQTVGSSWRLSGPPNVARRD